MRGLPEGGQVAAVCRISVGIVSPSAQSNRKNRKEKTLDVVFFRRIYDNRALQTN
ncbi:hypothetical protein BBMN23_0559 [Bifidobacterium adolescentis]|nr:hypothetical protein BBMN23_0559 [Bifidobacterium adolescentis]